MSIEGTRSSHGRDDVHSMHVPFGGSQVVGVGWGGGAMTGGNAM